MTDRSTKEHRDKDLIRVYRKVVKNLGEKAAQMSRAEIVMLILKHEAACFHTSLTYACTNVSALLKGRELHCSPAKRAMYAEIMRRYLEIVPDKHVGRDFRRIILDIIEGPAPCFYMEFGSLYNRLNRIIKKQK